MAYHHWLLLIQFAHHLERCEDGLEGVRALEDIDMVEDFLDAGRGQVSKLQRLLRDCEKLVLRRLGGRSTIEDVTDDELVEVLYGRDMKLEDTKALMCVLELWVTRWKDNCEPVLPE